MVLHLIGGVLILRRELALEEEEEEELALVPLALIFYGQRLCAWTLRRVDGE